MLLEIAVVAIGALIAVVGTASLAERSSVDAERLPRPNDCSNDTLENVTSEFDANHELGVFRLENARVAYKQVYSNNEYKYCVAELVIPRGAHVRMNSNSKHRASMAYVRDIRPIENDIVSENENFDVAASKRRRNFKYHVGTIVVPDSFDTDDVTCSGGIHFYRTQIEAVMKG